MTRNYFFQHFIWKALFFVFIIFAFLANTLHESYPDEFDNILGGWYILHGSLPYTGFFTHHGPIPYFIAAIVEIFSGQSFVRFRLLYAVFLIFTVFGSYYVLRKRLGVEKIQFFPFFIAFLGIEATYYWTQMLLADNIAAFTFVPAYALIVLKTVFRKKMTLVDLGIVGAFSSVALYSSLTYTYIFLLVNVSALYLYFKESASGKIISIKNLFPFLILFLPHACFILYLAITGSISDYIYQNYTFNTHYYIYNYPRTSGSEFINPLRYAVLIAHWFFINFYTVLIGIKSFEFTFPINATMAVGNLGLFIYLLFRKHYKLAAFVFLVTIFTNVRSNPQGSKETDYQAGVYNMLSFFNIFFLLPQLYHALEEKIAIAKKVIFGFLLLLVGIYGFFALLHLVFKFNEKTVSKYMGNMAIIYDRPKLAPVLNAVAGPQEYVWAGPFEFEELFYTNAKVPSKYHILIYGVGASEKIRSEMLADFAKNKPKVIFFDKSFHYLRKDVKEYSQPFLHFLDENYITLLNYHKGNTKYQSVTPIHVNEKLDLEAKLYIRKDKVDEVVAKLLENNYIKAANVK